MIEFKVAAKDFRKAVSLILVGRAAYMNTDLAHFEVVADSLEISSVGGETQIDTDVAQAGYAQVPLSILKDIRKVASTYKQAQLKIRIDDGLFRIESYSFRNPAIELRRIGGKIADIPVNAGYLDTLAMVKLLSAEEIVESGLTARVLEAQEKASAAVDGATSWLAIFEVQKEEVRKLVDAQLAKRASELKPNLRVFKMQ
jgi:hypothetical protein